MAKRSAMVMITKAEILGAVLAGGRSSRFGSDKAEAVVHGASLLDHAIAALAPFCGEVVVSGHHHPRCATVADRPRPDMGPLGGLNGVLHHAAARGFAGVLVTGCDMPSFPPELAEALIGGEAAVLLRQHLAGWWPVALAPVLDTHLAANQDRSLYGWIERASPRLVTLPGLILPNINRPEDLGSFRRASR